MLDEASNEYVDVVDDVMIATLASASAMEELSDST